MSTDYTTLGLGAAVGLALGLGIGAVTSNPDLGQLRSAFSDEIGTIAQNSSETVTGAVAAVSDKIDALSGSLDEKVAGSQARMAETVAALEARIAALAERTEAVGAAVEASRAAGAEATETMSASLAEMRGTLEDMQTRLAAAATGAAAAPAAEEAPAAEAGPEEAPIEGTTAGRVETLADGALRVFVSGVDEADGTARVAINGVETQVIRVGRTATVEVDGRPCSLTVDAIVQGHVQMTGDCGGAS